MRICVIENLPNGVRTVFNFFSFPTLAIGRRALRQKICFQIQNVFIYPLERVVEGRGSKSDWAIDNSPKKSLESNMSVGWLILV